MKILVTGGAGYIGSILVPQLLKEGHLVTVVDNFHYNQTTLLDYCHSSNFEIIRGDVTKNNFVENLYQGDFDLIIPLACLTGAPLCNENPERAIAVITDAIEYMLDTIGDRMKIIYPTTNSGYGIGEKSKFCTEETPLNPISTYGRLKANAEDMILKRGNSISLRLATVFGMSPRMRLDLLVNDFVYRAVNDSSVVLFEAEAKRNYVHVTDVARAVSHCIQNWETMKDNVYNVGLSSANLSKSELCDKIKEHVPRFVYYTSSINEDPDKRDYIVSNEKLEQTGWRVVYDLDDGIRELIKGYQIVRRNQYTNV